MTHTCATAISDFATGKLSEVRLPSGCALAEATRAIDRLATARDMVGNLGTEQVQVRWRAIDVGVAGARLLLWHDSEHVLALELESPRPAGGWPALHATLGAPDAKLAYWNDVVEAKDGMWIYAQRGLAVYTSLADTELVRAVLFAPTTVDGYQARLARSLAPPRELELP